MCNVSKGRVTQWITAGQISGAAIVGEGRSAMIDSELARAQLKERLAINERLGENGLNTKLDDSVSPPAPRAPRAPVPHEDTAAVMPNPPAPEGARK